MKRYIDGAGLGRRQLTTRRGIYLRSIIGIVLGEPVLLLLEVVVIEGGRIRARHGYPLSSKGEGRREEVFLLRCVAGWAMVRNGFGSLQAHRIVLRAFHLRVACPSTDGTLLQRARPFLQLSPPRSEGGRGTKVRVIISRPAFIKSRDASLSIRVRCVELLPLLQLSFANS